MNLIRADEIAVVTDKRPSDLPRPIDWHPTATLRLQARPLHARSGEAPLWMLDACHASGDASTAFVYRGRFREGSDHDRVVLKTRRRFSNDRIDVASVDDRFNYEVKALAKLGEVQPSGNAPMFATRYDANGKKSVGNNYPDDIGPLVFCLAANHALAYRPDSDKMSGSPGVVAIGAVDAPTALNDEQLPLATDRNACEGCGIYLGEGDIKTKRSACRKWVVTAAREAERERDSLIPLPRTQALILSDMGETLQSHLGRLATKPYDHAMLQWILDSVASLAERIAALHKLEWLHLDLNPNNICVYSEQPPVLVPIDFGQSEQLDVSNRHRQAFEDRIPFRQLEFAAPEMQSRQFQFRIPSNFKMTPETKCSNGKEVEPFKITFNSKEVFLGWPTEWWPIEGDFVRLESNIPGCAAAVSGKVFSKEKNVYTIDIERKISGAHGTLFKKGTHISAVLFRAATRESDIYTFGLVIMGLLFRHTRAVIIRDELAVAGRVIRKHIRPKLPPYRGVLTYLREAMPAHSAILDEAMASVREQLKSQGDPDDRAWRLVWTLAEVGVKCVLRNASGTAFRSFDEILERLHELKQADLSQEPARGPAPSLPQSLQQCIKLKDRRRQQLVKFRADLTASIDVCHERVAELLKKVEQIRSLAESVCRLTQESQFVVKEAKSVVELYKMEYQALSLFCRYIVMPTRRWVHETRDVACGDSPASAAQASQPWRREADKIVKQYGSYLGEPLKTTLKGFGDALDVVKERIERSRRDIANQRFFPALSTDIEDIDAKSRAIELQCREIIGYRLELSESFRECRESLHKVSVRVKVLEEAAHMLLSIVKKERTNDGSFMLRDQSTFSELVFESELNDLEKAHSDIQSLVGARHFKEFCSCRDELGKLEKQYFSIANDEAAALSAKIARVLEAVDRVKDHLKGYSLRRPR